MHSEQRGSTKDRKPGRLAGAMCETAGDMKSAGILREEAYERITIRHLGPVRYAEVKPLTGEAIRAMRERAHMSQAVFAHYLNVTVGYISQLERGTKRPTGAAHA